MLNKVRSYGLGS